jgi:hypothetical protein
VEIQGPCARIATLFHRFDSDTRYACRQNFCAALRQHLTTTRHYHAATTNHEQSDPRTDGTRQRRLQNPAGIDQGDSLEDRLEHHAVRLHRPADRATAGLDPESWKTADDWAMRIHAEDREAVVNFCISQSRQVPITRPTTVP